MDDDLLRARLRDVARDVPVRPRAEFTEALHDRLAAQLGLTAEVGVPAPYGGRTARVRPTGARWLLVAAVLALLVALLGALGGGAAIERLLRQPTLLESVEQSGRLRIGVRADGPQSQPANAALGGFDLDVAEAIAQRLGVRAQPMVAPADQLLDPDGGDWVMTMPSRSLPIAALDGIVSTDPYYRWPVLVAVSVDAPETSLADLEGSTICAVSGSAGSEWLASRGEAAGLEVAVPPVTTEVVAEESDTACLEELAAGRVRAIVTARLLEGDLVTAGMRQLGDGPVALEPAPILVRSEARGAGPLAERIDLILDDLRRDGTLRTISQRWFGGEDLTTP